MLWLFLSPTKKKRWPSVRLGCVISLILVRLSCQSAAGRSANRKRTARSASEAYFIIFHRGRCIVIHLCCAPVFYSACGWNQPPRADRMCNNPHIGYLCTLCEPGEGKKLRDTTWTETNKSTQLSPHTCTHLFMMISFLLFSSVALFNIFLFFFQKQQK